MKFSARVLLAPGRAVPVAALVSTWLSESTPRD